MNVFDFFADYGDFSLNGSFNGYLRDYLDKNSQDHPQLFEEILKINGDVRVYKNYGLKIMHDLVSNKMIGYKDIRKLPENVAKIPYILYWTSGSVQRAMLLNTDSYIEARGMYYAMTEPGNVLEPFKNCVLSLYLNESSYSTILQCFTSLQDEKCINGVVQKKLDEQNISDVDVMKEDCLSLAQQVDEDLHQMIANVDKKKRAPIIYHAVSRYFLLKKALYVRYMSNKRIVNERHGGNSSEARKFAKSYIDEIVAIPYYELWNE